MFARVSSHQLTFTLHAVARRILDPFLLASVLDPVRIPGFAILFFPFFAGVPCRLPPRANRKSLFLAEAPERATCNAAPI